MGFWETVWTGVISGVVAAGVIGLFAVVWRTTRPRPAFTLTRQGGSWFLTRTEDAVAYNVQWSVTDQIGMLVHGGEPHKNPPDMVKGEPEFILFPLLPDYQVLVYWGAHDRTNSHAVTIQAGVADYDVWPIGKRPSRRAA